MNFPEKKFLDYLVCYKMMTERVVVPTKKKEKSESSTAADYYCDSTAVAPWLFADPVDEQLSL